MESPNKLWGGEKKYFKANEQEGAFICNLIVVKNF